MTKPSIFKLIADFHREQFGFELPEDTENVLLAYKLMSIAAAKGNTDPALIAWAAEQVLPVAIEQYESGDNPLLQELIHLRDSGVEIEVALKELRARRDRVWGVYYDCLMRLCADRLGR